MTNIEDLHIQKEVLPLFDHTLNYHAKDALSDLLLNPLASVDEILLRQDILKGFIAHTDIFANYSYSRVDLSETYSFLEQFSDAPVSGRSLKLELFLSESERHRSRGKFIQTILLFHRLQTRYINRIDTKLFPEIYKEEIRSIYEFLNGFKLNYYEELVRENKFKVKHIVELTYLISEKKSQRSIKAFWTRFFLFEAYLSISQGIIKNRFVFPTFNRTSVLSFQELYHPLLKFPVKNSFSIRKNVVVLTGPNMSGKSTFLKSISLAVYLGHLGLGVAATTAVIPYFECITTHLDHNDDLVSGYSHFMSEVMNLKKLVIETVSQKKCFAVFDELFKGTNVEDALQISSTTLSGLSQFKNSVFFISTHLHQLKDFPSIQWENISTFYIDCGLENDLPVFNYQLKEGWSDLKIGQIIFEKEGLNKLLATRDNNTM